MENSTLLSIIIPVYKAENTISILVSEIIKNITPITQRFEIIMVNDGSPDKSWKSMVNETNQDERVKGINLSRNFGQHNAITAGLKHAVGEWIVVMDCDLQDRPDEIVNLYQKAIQGYDCVIAKRIDRQDHFLKRMSSKIFYFVFAYLTDVKQDSSIANFGIYNKKVINAVVSMEDQIKFFPTMVQWVGFNKFYLPVKHSEREDGKSSYSLNRLINLAVEAIISFSDKPLRLTIKLGFISIFLSFFVIIFYLILYLIGHIKVLGFTSLLLSFWFLSSIIIFILGVVGLYIGKIFDKVKCRPQYIVDKKINL